MDRFHEVAPRVLAQRTFGYFRRGMFQGVQLFILGGLPIFGIVYLGWSPLNWILLLIVESLISFLCDCVRVACLRKDIERISVANGESFFVGAVCDALRSGKRKAPEPHLNAGKSSDNPLIGLGIDLVLGTVSCLVIYMCFSANSLEDELMKPGFFWAVVGFAAFQVFETVWEIVENKLSPLEHPHIQIAPGLRGATLFIVMFVVLFCTDGGKQLNLSYAALAVYGINALIMLAAVVSLFGMFGILFETRWLKKYMASRKS